MCGIFGVSLNEKTKIDPGLLKETIEKLFEESQSRGKDASGIAISEDNQITVYKEPIAAKKLFKSKEFKTLISKVVTKNSANNKFINPVTFIGHARMETNGYYGVSENNQPVVKDNVIAIHNGIVVNDQALWTKFPDIHRNFEVDTEVINSLLRRYITTEKSLTKAISKVYSKIEGATSLSVMFPDYDYLLLATNNGSLYTAWSSKLNLFLFASEKHFLSSVLSRLYKPFLETFSVNQLKPNNGVLINLSILKQDTFLLKRPSSLNTLDKPINRKKLVVLNSIQKQHNPQQLFAKYNNDSIKEITKTISNEYQKNLIKVSSIKRCTRCILPETMPFIKFDKRGVCNYCHDYKKIKIKPPKNLQQLLQPYKNNDSNPDCLVAFSGGRDSSYALHYVKKVLGMNPIAYSYDWGMLTDLGRRNQSRMTGKLGIEHLLVSADIQKKRENIKKNVEAWLKKPELGTVPLFMAGDKQYFYYANKVKKENNLEIVIMGENYYEKTMFKNGFAGIKQNPKGFMAYHVSNIDKIKMLFYYVKQFATNSAYINNSLVDSFTAFFSYFLIPHKYINLFDFVRWNERDVNRVLKSYNWELSNDTDTTWRIGDGTASFYNYIYYTVAGFSEIDTFVSNQIREGVLLCICWQC